VLTRAAKSWTSRYGRGMTTGPDRCLARIQLDTDEVTWLATRPFKAHEVKPHPYCELEFGHPGPHAALGQQGNDIEWWVRWTLTASEILEEKACEAESAEVGQLGEHQTCVLFHGHPGRHSFEMI
jgi:hypothetical protein